MIILDERGRKVTSVDMAAMIAEAGPVHTVFRTVTICLPDSHSPCAATPSVTGCKSEQGRTRRQVIAMLAASSSALEAHMAMVLQYAPVEMTSSRYHPWCSITRCRF